MAVPGYEALCLDLAYPSGYTFAVVSYTVVNSPDGCGPSGKEWVAIQSVFLDRLIAASADSTGTPITPTTPTAGATTTTLSPDVVQAANLMFAAVCIALAVIWGAKRVLALFIHKETE